MDFDLERFVFERVLNEGESYTTTIRSLSTIVDPTTHGIALLGSLKPDTSSDGLGVPAIVRIERTPLPSFSSGLISTTSPIQRTDIVRSSYASLICRSLDAFVAVCVDVWLAEPFSG